MQAAPILLRQQFQLQNPPECNWEQQSGEDEVRKGQAQECARTDS